MQKFSELDDFDKIAFLFFRDEQFYKELAKRPEGVDTAMAIMELEAIAFVEAENE